MRRMYLGVLSFAAGLLVAPVLPARAAPVPAAEGPAVYLSLVEGATLPFADVVSNLEQALADHGWTVVGSVESGVDRSTCDYRAHVVIAYTPELANRLMAYGAKAAFAVPIRFAVYEDERGVNIGATNPMNLFRTIVDESSSPEDWADVARDIRAVTEDAFPDFAAQGEYGQQRSKARIGRTMGIMAGGKFEGKMENAFNFTAPGVEPGAIARAVAQRLGSVPGEWDWDLHPVYTIDLPEHGVAIVGVTSESMEARAFRIVGAGGNDARKSYKCPGIDHAAAFPIEVVVARTDDGLEIFVVDEMYRMKMFFEDAGKIAFAKNMSMPGSIENELKKKIEAVFGGN
ncbi:MAG: hypothetical protein ACE5GJ_04475 [Gemmatimonadota bacterium]